MLGYAYASNMARPMITTAENAAGIHACAVMGWLQRKIASEFHMSQPGVFQLMARYPPEGGLAEVIGTEGEDGKTYTRIPRGAHLKPKPWAWGGVNAGTVRKACPQAARHRAAHRPRRAGEGGPGQCRNQERTLGCGAPKHELREWYSRS